ncbi:MAG: bifunctional phosphoribosylaminoimidazolecarboxamide formyltransferase/IMP cyclohydrolase [Ignavibacteriales bacterium]|nr:bifunctional phosphoribosylaminoimidazolecarboxamide formyltransferase/IMP cyclohydrolase [Ignavibacteriales bacterium]
MLQIRRALLSVSDKEGLLEFAAGLHALGVELISTGGTHALLASNDIPVKQVSEITGFPEILDGRVKTLHPLVHGGLLAVRDNPLHRKQLDELAIVPFDMVVVNLYPFEATIAKPNVSLEQAIENIDIGGPAMLRSAAKNYRFTAAVTSQSQYNALLAELHERNGALSEETSYRLARKVFVHTSQYDAAIADYLSLQQDDGNDGQMTDVLRFSLRKEMDLRYGENPHQRAALYGNFLQHCKPLHGKELSYNNILDTDAAVRLVSEFDTPAVVIVKHMNPCGVGTGATLLEAYQKALATDRQSAFGGIVACNRPLDTATAKTMNEIFSEVIVAPEFPSEVLQLMTVKKDRRLLQHTPAAAPAFELRSVTGGVLAQTVDAVRENEMAGMFVVTQRQPTDTEKRALMFAWKVAKHVKSNAIVYAAEDRTLGIGAGQMSRVDSARVAVAKAAEAGLSLKECAVASDAFFPFADGLLAAASAGATAVIQPGGSKRDEEVIAAANQHNLAMIFTGVRHFRH